MKNVKTFVFGAGLLSLTFVALGKWCDKCNKEHQGCCPYETLTEDGCDSQHYNDYDSEGEQEAIRSMQARARQHHERNIEGLVSGIRRHVHTPDEIQRIRQTLNEVELQLHLAHPSAFDDPCNQQPYFDPCSQQW